MTTYSERVQAEKLELDTKIAALEAFLKTPFARDPHKLAPPDGQLLMEQLLLMRKYSKILGKRLARAGVTA